MGAINAESAYHAARRSRWTTVLARVGLAAQGFVYVLIGILAVQVARGARGKASASKGALLTLSDEPFGAFLLAAIGIGMFGYAFWRVAQAISDPQRDGSDAKGIALRIAKAGSGILSGAIGFFALNLAFGNGGGSGDGEAARHWTTRALSMPLGEWWVVLVGLGIVGFGVHQVVRGWKQKFRSDLKEHQMSQKERRLAAKAGTFGHIARGVVFGVTGLLLIQAGLQSDASRARGLDGALNTLAQRPYGDGLLAVVALGLASFGIYQFVEARYRRVQM